MGFSEQLKRALGVWLSSDSITELEQNTVPLTGIHTTSVEENVAGLSSAITLANAMKATMNTHAANGTIHHHGASSPDIVNFPVATADATDLTTLKALVGAMLTAYAAHNVDAIAATPTYHVAQDTTHALTSAVTPTTLATSITRLNDLLIKYNLHTIEQTAHATPYGVAEVTTAAANGAAIKFAVTSAVDGYSAQVTVLDGGAGSTKGSATEPDVDDGYLTVTFSKDPASDTVFSYEIFRNA